MNASRFWVLAYLGLVLGCSSGKHDAKAASQGTVACANPLTDRDVTLDPDEVHDIVEAHYETLRLCYERKLDLDPSLQGKIDVNLFVSSNGVPTRVCSAGSTLPNQQVVECVLHVFSQFRFAERSQATATAYPVTFSPY